MKFAEYKKLHGQTMAYLWILLINMLIIVATYSSSRTAIWIHSVGFALITGFTIFITFPILQKDYHLISPQKSFHFYFHVFVGCLCMCAVLFQGILGILTKMWNMFQGKSVEILFIKRLHMITGLAVAIIFKIQVYYMQDPSQRPVWLLLDFISLAFYCYRKFGVSRLINEAKELKDLQISKVTSLKQLKNEDSKLAVCGNYIYDLSGMASWHPAGFEIIQSVKDGQIYKYLLGIYSSSRHPAIAAHEHSRQALNLLDPPLAKLVIPSNFNGLDQENQASITELRLISKSSDVFELHLKPENNKIEFLKYTDIKQLGRYYRLTLNGKLNRLYTNVNFLCWKNAIFLKQWLPESENLKRYFLQRNCHSQSIPILFKRYPNGQFTNQLVEDRSSKLAVSQQLGLGLQLDEVAPGEIIIITGGTGIFPFLDLIDLIYKRHLADSNPKLSQTIMEQNPLVQSEIFNKFTFHVYAAFRSIQEVHPIVLQEMIQLSSSKYIKITLNINTDFDKSPYPQLTFTEDRFEKLAEKFHHSKQLAKIFVCGPSRMNEQLTLALKDKISENLITIY